MRKGLVLLLYGVALYFVLRNWYRQGNSGLPAPNVIAAPTYLYSLALITSDFLGPIPVIVAAGMTVVLAERSINTPSNTSNTPSQANTTNPNNPTGKSTAPPAPTPGPPGSPITGGYYTPGPRINPFTGKPYVISNA